MWGRRRRSPAAGLDENASEGETPIQLGKVYLVGAGPGHPELLTLKAAELLRTCDVVVYDRLIQEEVLALAKPSAERIYMGKPVGRHDSRQQEVQELLVRKAREGKIVVRLKGGDPFVFGRGGEEAEYLADRGVPFEVIPGVTSAFAAPLSAGIAVTHRGAASSVAVVTGHEAKKDHHRVNWQALAGIDTLVFLMGVSNVETIAETLIRHGKDPETPAAMIQMAFWHDELAVTGTLSDIGRKVKEAGVRPPATLVIGEVVRMRGKLARAERDLRRRPDGSSRFAPAPAPDQLFRLATAGLGTQVLGFALECRLFDELARPRSAGELASGRGWDAAAAAEVMEALTALGVLEKTPDGYRNLELAARYLRSDAPESLREAVLYQCRLAAGWSDLKAYVRGGCRDFIQIPAPEEALHQRSCEALARFAAPAVADKLDLGGKDPALIVGYGGERYREAIGRRWPKLSVTAVNPFRNPGVPLSLQPGLAAAPGSFGAVILSGLLGSSNRGEVQQFLEWSARWLRPGGLLALHDSFLPGGVLPPPEVVLGALGRRMRRGGCRTWSIDRLRSALAPLGFDTIKWQNLHAGTVLVTARRS